MQLTSPAFINNERIPEKYTCTGSDISPHLSISNVPKRTKSFVLVFQDRDAEPKAWIHWLLFNIPASTKEIPENVLPNGAIEGISDDRKPGYKGPCPKYFSGVHRYVFTLYALDTVLDIPQRLDISLVIEKIIDHMIDKAQLIGVVQGYQHLSMQL